mmetsp:Transcript_57477/g.173793  ORF Transcript_57477/g.173793 Transcript_57477/m.173793 type:complete len:210 (-) Transcript_57477:558-1187(-)
MHGVRLERLAEEVVLLAPVDELVDLDNVLRGDHGLLLTRVRDLGDRRDRPVFWRLARLGDAARVAVADGVDPRVALVVGGPDVALARLHRQRHVHEDPAAAAGALLAEGLLGHEVVGGLDADADILLVCAVLQFNLVPEGLLLWRILHVVKLLDAVPLHVLRAVLGSARGQGPQRLGQEVDDGALELGEEVPQLRDPLHADEAGADNEH